MVVDAEAVSGVDTDVRVFVARCEMGAHDPGALLKGEGVPGSLLRHRIDDHVREVTHRSGGAAAVLLPGVLMLAEILALAAGGEIAVGAGAPGPEARRGEAGLGRPQRIGIVADQPEQQVGVGARADERVGVSDDAAVGKGLGEFAFLGGALVVVEAPPFRGDGDGEEAVELVHRAISSRLSCAAVITASIVSSSWASERKRHSNWDGGSSTPRRSIPPWNAANFARSERSASS